MLFGDSFWNIVVNAVGHKQCIRQARSLSGEITKYYTLKNFGYSVSTKDAFENRLNVFGVVGEIELLVQFVHG